MRDYFGERGCCIACKSPREMEGHQAGVWSEERQKWYDCLCSECKCTRCDWYDDVDFRCAYQPGSVIVWLNNRQFPRQRPQQRPRGEGG